MAFYDVPRTASTSRLRRVISQLLSDLSAWREECAARDALGKLTDHELRDIGLQRGDLNAMNGNDLRND